MIDIKGVQQITAASVAFKHLDRDVKKALRAQTRREVVDPFVREAKGAADSRQAKRAAETIQARGGDKPGVQASHVLFYGSEFGGGKRQRRYVTTSRAGNRYWVNRHTTRQFRPHRGRRGYWFYPVLRARSERIVTRWAQIVLDAVGEAFGAR